MSLRATTVAAALCAAVAPAAPGAALSVEYTDAERAVIIGHGPWPPPWSGDASNRVSRSPAAIRFGRLLFFDPQLSATGQISCAFCHQPDRNWTDGRKLGAALAEVDRNTPTIADVRFNRWFSWDGSNDSLWSQSIRPLLDAREMGMTEKRIADLVRSNPGLSCHYQRVFGAAPGADNERVLIDIGKALAAFQETLVAGRAPFDDFRDALARGDRKAQARYPVAAQRGAKIFAGRGNCSLCHFGPNFSHGEFHEIGIPIQRKSGGVDWGRYQGIKMLRASRFNLLSAYNDDRQRADGISTRHVQLADQTFEQFRVPGLRNVARTAPYMHNGHFATLPEVVRHYSQIDNTQLHLAHVYLGGMDGLNVSPPTDTLLQPLKLSTPEIADVVAFLETLTEKRAQPLPPLPADQACAIGSLSNISIKTNR